MLASHRKSYVHVMHGLCLGQPSAGPPPEDDPSVVGDTVGDMVGLDVVGDTVGLEVVGDTVGDVVGLEVVGDTVGLDVVGDCVGLDVVVDMVVPHDDEVSDGSVS